MDQPLKSGRLSKKEWAFIDENPTLSDEQVAQSLGRRVESVVERRAQIPAITVNSSSEEYISQLHKKYFWKTTRKNLLSSEVRDFELAWAALFAQFVHQGVTATDELQMKDLIMEDIMLNRSMRNQKKMLARVQKLEQLIRDEKQKPIDDRDGHLISSMGTESHQLRSAVPSYTKEINEIKRVRDNKFRDLKSTRADRLKTIEESGRNFFQLVKLLDEQHMRESEGRMSALVEKASNAKREQFEQEIAYSDGEYDRPFLTPEAVLKGIEKEVHENDIQETKKKTEDTDVSNASNSKVTLSDPLKEE